jgi:hypothetical protein
LIDGTKTLIGVRFNARGLTGTAARRRVERASVRCLRDEVVPARVQSGERSWEKGEKPRAESGVGRAEKNPRPLRSPRSVLHSRWRRARASGLCEKCGLVFRHQRACAVGLDLPSDRCSDRCATRPRCAERSWGCRKKSDATTDRPSRQRFRKDMQSCDPARMK